MCCDQCITLKFNSKATKLYEGDKVLKHLKIL